jgi:hypothetical protein
MVWVRTVRWIAGAGFLLFLGLMATRALAPDLADAILVLA